MHLYRRKWKGPDGEPRTGKTWWLVAHVGGQRLHVSTRSRDRRAAELVAAQIVRRAELRRAGVADAYEDEHARALPEHVADFLTTLKARGVVPKYVRDRADCLQEFLDATGVRTPKDLTLVRASAWVEALKARGLSARSVNRRVAALKQLGRWLVAAQRLGQDPFAALRRLNEAEDRRHERRALTPEEAVRLLEAARTRPLAEARAARCNAGVSAAEHARLTRLGETRAVIYSLALGAGLRAGEIRRLRWQDLEGGLVRIPAASAKSRRDQAVPLPGRLLDLLRAYRPRAAGPADPVVPAGAFPNSLTFHRDLKAADIPRRDATGRVVDFHALRTTYVSWLAATGAHPRTAQALARHADIALTMQRYTDPRLLDLKASVERLPLPEAPREAPAAEPLRTWNRRA